MINRYSSRMESEQITQGQQKLAKIKAEIRNRFHQEYFRKVRASFQQNTISEPYMTPSTAYQTPQQPNKPPHLSYNIRLNNKATLYPEPSPSPPHPNPSSQPWSLSSMHLQKLSSLHNSLQQNPSPTMTQLCGIISNIIDEIEWRVITLCGIQSPESLCQESNSLMYQEYYGVLFVLFAVYRQAQMLLIGFDDNTWKSYRLKLQAICNNSGVGREMINRFGIQAVKAIQYTETQTYK